MTKRIFRALIGISLVVCLVGMATVFAVLYYYFENQITMEMESEVKYLAASVEEYGQQALDNLPSDAQRVTLIAPDGTVLFDNYADPAQMDNHLNREEVRMALQNGYAESTRRSDTFRQQMVYCAIRLEDDNVLRISSTQYTAAAVLESMIQPVIGIVICILLVVGFLAARISRKIVEPLNQLDLENPEKNESYDELTPLLTKISWQQKTIREQLLQAMQQQEELKMITDNMQEGLLLIDNKGDILSSNTSALKILGVSPQMQHMMGSLRFLSMRT